MEEFAFSRGRPPQTDPLEIHKILNEYRYEIVRNASVISKLHPIWKDIAKRFNDKLKPNSLYTYACKLFNKKIARNVPIRNSGGPMNTSISDMSATGDDSINVDIHKFDIPFKKEDFLGLTFRKQDKGRRRRVWTKLKPGVWESVISDKILEVSRLTCGFLFKNHYLTNSVDFGYIKGHCKCGSRLNIDITSNESTVTLKCAVEVGSGKKCSKRWLRQPIRREIGKELTTKTVEVYRAEKAKDLMVFGDPEPPTLYSAEVYHGAKNDYLASTYVDPDPFQALFKLMFSKYINEIKTLCASPFTIHYFTVEQLHLYQSYCSQQITKISIDATGSICYKIAKPYNNTSSNIFLYHIVVHSGKDQFSVAQMLTESHNTDSIHHWLMVWIRSGAPIPKEVVVDFSRALLNAIARAFTFSKDIDDYADKCFFDPLPSCYLRIDVAHFIHIYVRFLKGVKQQKVKRFYLAAIGQLIICRNKSEAYNIIKAIFTVCYSDCTGLLPNGHSSVCETEKNKIQQLITEEASNIADSPQTLHEDLHPSLHSDPIDTSDDDINSWSTWGKNIMNEAKRALEEEGDAGADINPLYMPDLGDKLMKHIKLLPLWSNVLRDGFGYGRVPASSSSCEGEFNKIKNVLLRHGQPLLRCDVFVDKHIKYLQGKLNIVAGNFDDTTISNDLQRSQDESLENVLICESFSENDNSANRRSEKEKEGKEMVDVVTKMDGCGICASGNLPQGAHTCIVCKKNVHPFPPCSVSFNDEEGYGSRRVCNTCDKGASTRDILASRETENWRGQGMTFNDTISKGLYLGKNKEKVKDALQWKKHSKLPVLKNGNSTVLHAVEINNKKVSVGNTCAFDSLIQVIFTAAVDNDAFLKQIEENSDNSFFQLVIDMVKNGVGPQSYRMRAKILMDICPSPNVTKITDKMIRLACEMSVITLIPKLIGQHLGITETASCEKGCTRKKQIMTVSLDEKSLCSGNAYEDLISNCHVSAEPRKCENSERLKCTGTMSSKINNTALIFAVEVYGLESTRAMIPLKKLLPQVTIQQGKIMKLIGVVNYRGPVHLRDRSKNAENIGHYTAVCKRGTTWYEYDDSNGTTNKRKDTYKIVPSLLLFLNLCNESTL